MAEQREPVSKASPAETTLPASTIELSDVGEDVVNVEALDFASKDIAVRVAIWATSPLKVVKGTTCGYESFFAVLACNIRATVDLRMDVLWVLDVSQSRVDQGGGRIAYGSVVGRIIELSIAR